jgi:hypothetical protein
MKKRTIAQTPASSKDIIRGSNINKVGSASNENSSKIVLSDTTIKVLQDKLNEFKKKHPNNKNITLNDLKAVYRRGSGAYSTSHRPNITRAGWSYARVNKFLEKAAGNKVKKAYIQDDDLLKYEQGGKVINQADKMGKQIICKNCGWKWNTNKSDEYNKYICHKCNFDNRTFYDSEPIGYANGGLIAPNSMPSNLTPEQYNLVRTPAFKKWFGDWENDPQNASKVVDENGEPLVVYHFTRSDFTIFKPQYYSYHDTFFFTPYKNGDFNYRGDRIINVFLNIKKLSILSNIDKKNWSRPVYEDKFIIESQKDESQSQVTFDGSIFKGIPNSTGIKFIKAIDEKEIIVAFNPNDIKLADGTNTTFDPNNPDIRYKQGGNTKTYWYKGLFKTKYFN